MKKVLLFLLILTYFSFSQLPSSIKWWHLSQDAKDSLWSIYFVDSTKQIVSDSLNWQIAADTTQLKTKSASDGRYVYLKQLSATNPNGGGWFVLADSIYQEGGVAFNSSTTGKQWVRVDYRDDPSTVYLDWFGATPDSSADATVQIQSALDYNAKNVIGRGIYKISSSLKLNSARNIFGPLTIIQISSGKNGIENTSNLRLYNMIWENVTIKMGSGIVGNIGLDFTDVSNSVFFNVNVSADNVNEGFNIALRLRSINGCYRNDFFHSSFRTYPGVNSIAIYFDSTSATSGANSNKFYGGEVRADSGIGVYILSGDENVISGVRFEGNTKTAVKIVGDGSTSQGNYITNSRFEGVTNGIIFTPSSVGNAAYFNFYTSGATISVVDSSGERNIILEPMATAGSRFNFSRGAINLYGSGANISVSNPSFAIGAKFNSSNTYSNVGMKGNGRFGWGSGTLDWDVVLSRSTTGFVIIESGAIGGNNKLYVGESSSTPRLFYGVADPISTPPSGFFSNGSLYLRIDNDSTLYTYQNGTWVYIK